MKHHSDKEVDLQLIGKYLAGEATPREALTIDVWREKSPQNNQTFESVAQLWEESLKEKNYRQPQITNQWEKLKRTIEEEQQRTILPLRSNILIRWRTVAAVLILLGLVATFYIMQPSNTLTTYGNVIHAEKSVIKDTLKDASIVSLFHNSRLFVSDQFAVRGREVKLEGESYFSVKQFPGQPFIIHTGGIEIVVLGTTFNVKDYSEGVVVSVRSGAVKMQKDTAGLVVPAGSTGVFYKTDQQFTLYSDSLNINDYSYATRELYFNNVSMTEVKEILESSYNVKVLLKDKSLAALRINTYFKEQPLGYVAEVLSASLDIQYSLKNDTLYFFH